MSEDVISFSIQQNRNDAAWDFGDKVRPTEHRTRLDVVLILPVDGSANTVLYIINGPVENKAHNGPNWGQGPEVVYPHPISILISLCLQLSLFS
jgi:hypothetical protein